MADKKMDTTKEVKVFARHIHMSPRKLRLVADMVRNEPVDMALEQLRFSAKKAALPLAKAINSGIANAQHNFNMNREDLYIKTVTIDGGPTLMRFKPRAQGRAGAIHKRTSHINLILSARQQMKKKSGRSIFNAFSRKPKTESEVAAHTHDHDHEIEEGKAESKPQNYKQAPRNDEQKKQNKVSLKRRLFNRKSGE